METRDLVDGEQGSQSINFQPKRENSTSDSIGRIEAFSEVEWMGRYFYYFFKPAFFGAAALLIIPKDQYKKFFLYGLYLGAVGDIVYIALFSGLFHAFKYTDLGPFGVFGLFSFWSPLAWMFAFMFFLYLLPRRRAFLYGYLVIYAVFGMIVGIILQNLGILHYYGAYSYIAPLVFLAWFSIAAWVFVRSEKIELIS